jgi:hypothetical protein
MEEAVIIGDGWLVEIAVAEFDCVRDNNTVGGGVHNFEAAVVV